MPLQKILFKPGVNKENTRYTTEGGWYECDKVRFRQGNPEVIGGWNRLSTTTFLGVCRSLWNWVLLDGRNIIGVGTNLKFYLENGGAYNDITPIRATSTINNNPFAATNGSAVITVTDTAHGGVTGDFVTFSGAVSLGGNITAPVLNAQYQIAVINANTYTFTATATANATDASGSPGGGASVVAAYQINVGPAEQIPLVGWGAGGWGLGTWGNGVGTLIALRLWSQQNFGEDLVFNPRGGGLYYWDAGGGLTSRGVLLNSLGGNVTFTNASPTVVTSTSNILFTEGAALQFAATTSLPTGISAATNYYVFEVDGLTFKLLDNAGAAVNTASTGTGVYVSLIVDVPTVQNNIVVSDTSRFVIAFGCNDYPRPENSYTSTLDPMLIRWSAQDDIYNWTPDPTNQAGFIRISHGSEIITTVQTRQEIIVFTDSAVYSLQYLGPPYVWAPQLLGDNVSIMGPNAAAIASGIVYWMGVDKFYSYDGRVQTLNCDLRRFVFSDLNQDQGLQVFAGTNEGFNEVWWFYCSANSTAIDKYVIYNYVEKIWYYGTMSRTAWLDSGLQSYPIAANYFTDTSTGNLINHETGLNDNTTGTAVAIDAYISSSEFDIGDGHNFGFVWRVLPDLTFENATSTPAGALPSVAMTLQGLANSGSGVTSTASQPVSKSNTYVITEQFTGQIYTRMRGRQMIFKISSNQINTCWQLGAPRIDIRPDGRR
jgi:hypothetical protein